MEKIKLKTAAVFAALAALTIFAAAMPTFAEEAKEAPPAESAVFIADDASEAASCEAAAAYTLATPDITLSNVSSGMKVVWNAVSGAKHYKVLRRTESGSWIAQTVTTGTSYIDTTGSSGTVYWFKVRCCDSTGNTMLSPNTDGKCLLRLKAPSLTSQTNTDEGVKLAFGKPYGTENYDVARKSADGGSWVTITDGSSKVKISSPFVDKTAVLGESYYYRVRAVGYYLGEDGVKTRVRSVWANFAEPITRLVSPEVTAKNKTTGVGVTWDAVPGAVNYAVLRKTETGSWIKKAVTASTSWVDTEALSGRTYQYKVRCVDASGENYTSPNPTVVTTHTFMAAPKIVSSSNLADGLSISWNEVDGAASYIVFRKTSTGTSWVNKGTVTGTSFTDTSVKSGSSYYYTLRAVNENGVESARYTTVELRTYIGMPTPVSAVNGPEGVTFTWEAPNGAEYFRVLRKYGDNGAWTKKEVVHGTSFTDVNVISGAAYHYTVRPVDPSGENYIGPRDGVGVRTFFLRQPKLKSAESADGGVLVRYSTVAGADRYEILRSEGGGAFAVIGSAAKGVGEYLDTTAVFDTEYVYTVRAVSDAENASSTGDAAGISVFFEDISCILYVNKPIMGLYTNYGSSSAPAMTVKYMDRLTYLETTKEYASGSWIKVEFAGSEYYFWQPADAEPYTVHQHSSFEYAGATQYEQDLIDLSMDMYTWPIKYRHGEANGVPAEDGTYGFDCSGFAAYVLKNVMQKYVPTYWVTTTLGILYQTQTIYNKGIDGEFSASTVTTADLRPGDLLFFNLTEGVDPEEMGDTVTHTAVYLGNNEFIHCTHSDYGVEGRNIYIMPLTYQYLNTLVSVRRYLPETVTPADVAMYVVTKADIRSAMTSSAPVIDTLGAETPVTVRFTNVDRTTGEPSWAYVEYGGGKTGFVQLKYLTGSLANESQKRWVAMTSIKLYDEASTSSGYTELFITTEVTFCGRHGTTNFYKVAYGGRTRYLYAKDGAEVDSKLTADLDALLSGVGKYEVTKYSKLRSNMDSSNDDSVIGSVSQGDEVTLIAVSPTGNWAYVRTDNGKYGFMLYANLKPAS